MSDIRSLAKDGNKSWVITLISSSGQDEPDYPFDVQFNYGDKLNNNTYENQKLTFSDVESFDKVYNELDAVLTHDYNHPVCRQNYYYIRDISLCWQFHNQELDVNTLTKRISYSTTCWDIKALEIATKIAESFNRHMESRKAKGLDLSPMFMRTSTYDI